MKKLLFSSLLVLSAYSAFAGCPELKGSYINCAEASSLNGKRDYNNPDSSISFMKIEQGKTDKGIDTYVVTTDEAKTSYITDNKTTFSISDDYITSISAGCYKNKSLIINVNGESRSDDISQDFSAKLSLYKNNDELVIEDITNKTFVICQASSSR